MRTVSERWADLIVGSRRHAVEAHLYQPDGTYDTELPVIDGTVNLVEGAAIRASCDLTLQGTDWVPRSPFDRLAPYGAEINVKVGFEYDGVRELVSVGWFGVEDVEVVDDGAGLATRVTGMDRARRLEYALLEDDIQLDAGTSLIGAAALLGFQAWPDMPISEGLLTSSTLSTGVLTAAAGENRWEQMQTLALAAGLSLYFDADGQLTATAYTEDDPVAEVTEGEGGVLVQASRTWSRANAFNRVIVTSENTEGTVYRGVATDTDPLSPTNYDGPFGHAPRFYSNGAVTSDDGAEHVANTILAKERGTASSINFGMVPNPALEPGDTIRVVRDRAGINENHVIESVSIGLGPDQPMTCSTRERLVTP